MIHCDGWRAAFVCGLVAFDNIDATPSHEHHRMIIITDLYNKERKNNMQEIKWRMNVVILKIKLIYVCTAGRL